MTEDETSLLSTFNAEEFRWSQSQLSSEEEEEVEEVGEVKGERGERGERSER